MHRARQRLTRVRCVTAGLLLCLLVECPLGQASVESPQRIDSDLLEVSIPRLEGYFASGRYSAREVTRWYLDRISKYNPNYNAFIKVFEQDAMLRAARLDKDAASGVPRAKLWGVPVVVKGSISLAHEVTTVGWWGYTRPGLELRSPLNATVIDRLLAAGAIIIGYTNLPDLANSNTTNSSVAGRTGNAYDPAFSPGGSSGGSATAVSANFALAALGTDGGNSIRNPASNLALVGFIGTKGLVSLAGVHSTDRLRERVGPLTRTVEDAALMLDVLAGQDQFDPLTHDSESHIPTTFTSFLRAGSLQGKRFGVPKFIFDGTPNDHPDPNYWNGGTSPATRAAFLRAVADLRNAGAVVVFSDDILPEAFVTALRKIQTNRWTRESITDFLERYGPAAYHSADEFEAIVGINYPDSLAAQDSRHVLRDDPDAERLFYEPLRAALEFFRSTLKRNNLDGIVYPPLQVPPTFEEAKLPADFPSDGPYSSTGWVNKLGIPAVVVPAGFYGSGLPFGLEIAGDLWSDGALLSYAYDFEQHTHRRTPPKLTTGAAKRWGAADSH